MGLRSVAPLLLVCLVVPGTGTLLCGQTDEESIRTMYYKHAYLVSLEPVVSGSMMAHIGRPIDEQTLHRKVDAARLDINLSNFKIGPIQDVLDRQWGKVYDSPAPTQEMLQINIDSRDFQDADEPVVRWQMGTAKWIPVDPVTPQDILDLINSWPVKRVLDEEQKRLKNGVIYTRYATYTVAIRFQGKTANYKAICFLSTAADGSVLALPEDGFIQSNLSGTGSSLAVFPTALLHTSLAHEYLPLQDWLRQHSVSNQACHSGRQEFCCTGDSCGVGSADLEHELAQPMGGSPE